MFFIFFVSFFSRTADNFSQFGGTLPRRSSTEVTATSTGPTATFHHQSSRHVTGSNTQHGHQQHALQNGTATTMDRRNCRNAAASAAASTALASAKSMFGSCNNLIENQHSHNMQPHHQQQSQPLQTSVYVTRARSPSSKLNGFHNGHSNNNNNNNNGGCASTTLPQAHWLHQSHQQQPAYGSSNGNTTTTPPKCATLPKDMDDLIHLPGPLTEDAVMRTLQARFADGKHFVRIRFSIGRMVVV